MKVRRRSRTPQDDMDALTARLRRRPAILRYALLWLLLPFMAGLRTFAIAYWVSGGLLALCPIYFAVDFDLPQLPNAWAFLTIGVLLPWILVVEMIVARILADGERAGRLWRWRVWWHNGDMAAAKAALAESQATARRDAVQRRRRYRTAFLRNARGGRVPVAIGFIAFVVIIGMLFIVALVQLHLDRAERMPFDSDLVLSLIFAVSILAAVIGWLIARRRLLARLTARKGRHRALRQVIGRPEEIAKKGPIGRLELRLCGVGQHEIDAARRHSEARAGARMSRQTSS